MSRRLTGTLEPLPLDDIIDNPLDAALADLGGYRTVVFCRATGLTFRQVDYLDRTGILSPSVAVAKGSGSQRVYSAYDIAIGRVLRALRSLSAEDDACRPLVRALRALPPDQWPDRVLIDAHGRIHRHLDCDGWLIRLEAPPDLDVP